MPEVKRIFGIFACLALLFGLSTTPLWALEADLYQGDVKKGAVSILDKDGLRYAALEEMLARLGMAPTPQEGGLVATFSGKKIEFWGGANAARVNGVVFTMPSAVFSSGGHWWGEMNASLQAMSQFMASAGRPSNLKWDAAAGAKPAAQTPQAPAATPQTVRVDTKPAANPVPQTASGGLAELSNVRWGEQTDAYRAVVDISKQADVTIKELPGSIEVTFARTRSPGVSSKSPWFPMAAASKQSGENTILTIQHMSKNVKGFWLPDPPRFVMDFYFDSASATTAENRVATPVAPVSPSGPPQGGKKKFLVVVDAGHGGHDPGAIGNNLKEKDINLKASLEFAESLKRQGLEVRLTRADDRYLKLAERTEIANTSKADIFISLHCNALPKGKHASGIELYLMADSTDKDALNLAIIENREISGNAQSAAEINAAADKRTKLLLHILGDMQQNDKINESTTLAEHIYNRMQGVGLSIRKVRQAPFFVLKGAGMPALLVEMGYISEKSDAALLNSQAYRKKMLDALALGILNYLQKGR